jgi:hypothetical protein
MKHFQVTISLRDAAKAQNVINCINHLRKNLDQTSTNVWEDLRKDYEDEDIADEYTLMLLDDFMGVLDGHGIEFEKRVYNED